MKEFMHKYDKNADGKIEMAEVSEAGGGGGRGCGTSSAAGLGKAGSGLRAGHPELLEPP